MKTLLEAIKKYPEQFISTCIARSETTPNQTNELNHLSMSVAIKLEAWNLVAELLVNPDYNNPLKGVLFCLPRYSDIGHFVYQEIIELFEEGKLV